MIQDYFSLAFKNLKHRGIRSWLTLLGIFIGVTAVVSLISLGEGLEVAVASQFGISETELISVEAGGLSGYGPPGSMVSDPLRDEDLEAIKKLGSVDKAAKRYIQTAKMEYNDNLLFGYATSIPSGEDREFIYSQLEVEPITGRLLRDSDRNKVFLGYNYYIDKVGFEKEIRPGKTILINEKKFEVIGILDRKGSMLFDNVVYMNEKDLEELFDIQDDIDIIAVLPRYSDEMEKTKEDIERTLRKVRNVKEGEEDFTVSTPEATMSTLNDILSGVQIFIIIVASISIFIGALGIVNTMTTSVLERKNEIGVMKSVGARNEHVFYQFFVESSILGLVGGAIGAIFGTLIGFIGTQGINSFLGADLTPNINFSLIFFSLLGSFLIGGIAGIIPAMRASKQNPVEALRS
ncbi:MAG TPA: ABC transporter permease [Candidatus Nanoarchaeia archaeon]|nr:ABC transporter permease [Candidatus Nanoarchaeia archaeon]